MEAKGWGGVRDLAIDLYTQLVPILASAFYVYGSKPEQLSGISSCVNIWNSSDALLGL